MSENETNAEPSVEHDERLGIRTARFGRADAGEALVEVPNLSTDGATISVTGEAFDDQPGHIVVHVGGGASVELALSVDEARDLAERIDRAADEAELDI